MDDDVEIERDHYRSALERIALAPHDAVAAILSGCTDCADLARATLDRHLAAGEISDGRRLDIVTEYLRMTLEDIARVAEVSILTEGGEPKVNGVLVADILNAISAGGRNAGVGPPPADQSPAGGSDVGGLALSRAGVAPPAGPPWGALSPHELEVAGLIAQGLTGVSIADELGLSERTIDTHSQAAYRKLGAPAQDEGIDRRVWLSRMWYAAMQAADD